ncbi:aminopeptidase P N-terminal domain-containing protein [Cyanobacterium stanieri LEGE 03274]|uniref:Xaa-Pro aminopeptidase n=1 Tax=Cyanobacterium stanieri LEGE 03274 TaxID=1828756 RepID=A0ABR9V0E2_9CHRO|nr:aminopeptidase P N-terminal domain-containing protein [Cyanobacterium stanieri]MBE9221345.1 aminopeptidase P N-terminal domain-containing protein [Cyanobacterium stanieri LEGE 03274]
MMIAQQEYAQRRELLMSKMGKGVAVFRSAPMAVMHNDVEYVYRQDSDFFYLTGFNEPEAVAILAPNHDEHRFILFVQPKDLAKEIWTGYRAGVEGAKENYGADAVFSIEQLDEKLSQYLVTGDRIYYHLGRDQEFNQKILNHWQKLVGSYPRNGYGPRALEDSNYILHPLRMVKSATEIEMLRKAASISAKAHIKAQEFATPGRYEYEVQGEIEYIFKSLGCEGPAYPSIVASGANACVLHYIENNRRMEEGDLLLIDAGASFGYYNGDITRTFPVSGNFTPEQKAIYDLVLEAQLKAIAQVQPGNTYNQYHDTAVEVLVEGLKELKLLQGDTEEIIKEKKYQPFYMHRTGHWLGLDVHDVGNYKLDKVTWQTLQAGNVLTVEPGIYISPYITPAEGQPEIPDHWKGIGVRIEDDVLVTKTGNEILTSAVSK